MKREGVKNYKIIINYYVIIKGRGECQMKLTQCQDIIGFFFKASLRTDIMLKCSFSEGKCGNLEFLLKWTYFIFLHLPYSAFLSPVRAITGVPRHVATNNAPAMGTLSILIMKKLYFPSEIINSS